MKIKSAIYTVLLAGLLLPLLLNCKKEVVKILPEVELLASWSLSWTMGAYDGNIIKDGGATVTERGVCWSTTQNPTVADNKITNGTGLGWFTGSISKLTGGTIYNIRAFATNSVGTTYSNQLTFNTFALKPILTTTQFSLVNSTSVTGGGIITSDGGSTVTYRGVCWDTVQTPSLRPGFTTSDGKGSGSFTSFITGLIPGTTYYFRAYAINDIKESYGPQTGYGNQVSITIPAVLPVIKSTIVSIVTATKAISGVEITSDGGALVIARGVCWSTSQNPTISNLKTSEGLGVGSFKSSPKGLLANTTYNLRAYATNSSGTSYGDQVSFKTSSTVNDIEGNIYNTVTIGTQVWMVENLKTTKFRNGDPIPNLTTSWTSNYEGAYCDYNNNPNNSLMYGKLYSEATLFANKGLTPLGWHVPTSAEWQILETYLVNNGFDICKSMSSTSGWTYSEAGGTVGNDQASNNSTGFTAYPGGMRVNEKKFDGEREFTGIGNSASWWSTSTRLHFDLCGGVNGGNYGDGYSVRCLMD